jgi:NAD(P)H-nitrite reductase large subunit
MGRYVIVGNGVAGTKAAEVLRLRRPEADIVLLAEEPYPFYRRPQLADYAAGAVGEARLWAKRDAFYAEQRIDMRLSTRVESVDAAAGTLALAGGETLGYDGLVVATGRYATAGGVKGGDAVGVNHFKTLADAQAVRAITRDGKTGVVYGNGLASLEMVRALTAGGFATTYIVPTERLWPDVLDDEAAGIVASRVRAAGAELVLGVTAEAISGAEDGPKEIHLAGGRALTADVVGVCAGYAPAVEWLPGGGAGFAVDQAFATPWPGIWAAGDVTQGGGSLGFNWLRSWRHGAAAVAAMLGEAEQTRGEVDVLDMAALGLSVVALGKTTVAYRSGFSEMCGDYPYAEFYKKLVFDADDVLVGALLLGNVAEATALEDAVRAKTRRSALDEALLHQMFDVTYRATFAGVQCPVCRHEFPVEADAKAGDRVACPVCGMEFTLADGPQGFVVRAAK